VALLSDSGMSLEEIADLCGPSGTFITESVYRHQLRPVPLNGAVAMDRIFRPNDSHRPVPDGDDEAVAQEDHDVTGVDHLRCRGQFGVLDVLRGAQDQQVDVAVAFHDRPVTVSQGLLDGQGVEAEGPGDRHHHLGAGVVQPQPDERVASPSSGGVGVRVMRSARFPLPVDVQRAVDHSVRIAWSRPRRHER
jgi:hypothetical protein